MVKDCRLTGGDDVESVRDLGTITGGERVFSPETTTFDELAP